MNEYNNIARDCHLPGQFYPKSRYYREVPNKDSNIVTNYYNKSI